MPYEDRIKNYIKIRDRIFKDKSIISRKTVRSRNRLKTFWAKVRNYRKSIRSVIATISKKHGDSRPYGEVSILGKKWLGLLDSGAAVSCLGADLADSIIKQKQLKMYPMHLQTADGRSQAVFGNVSLEVEFKNKIEIIKFYIVPSLTQNVILGIDFWKLFDVAPSLIGQIDCKPLRLQDQNDLDLSETQKSKLERVISSFPSFEKEGLGKTSYMEHVIELEGNVRPVKQRYFPVSPAIEKLIHAEIDSMLELDIIEEAPHSPWSSPIVLIRKGEKVRLCLDSRKVNSFTIKDAYPLPQIEGILSRLPKAKFISSLDLRKAFWQIPLSDNSKDLTCFTVPNRPLYRFKVMPFGLCNAPQALCRLMDQVIPPSLKNQVFVYLDDLLIISENFEQHIQVLFEVAYKLRKANLTINIEKSKFLIKEVKYLGYIVGDGVLRTDPEKVSAVLDYPSPSTVKQLRRFLGMAGWYRRFIHNFALITTPLTDLIKKGKKFHWNDQAQKAFEELKRKLCSAPVLSSPNYDKPFIIQCDASKYGIGAVLSQENEEKVEVPIAYFSKKLSNAQQNYSVTELECLAAILGLKKFRAYVEGQDFKIVTDHASLKWLLKQPNLTGKLARWAMKLQGFRFKIEHRRGADNLVPDWLSRIEIGSIEDSETVPLIDLNSSEFRSERYLNLLTQIRANELNLPDLKIVGDQVYKRTEHPDGDPEKETFNWKLWVPESLIDKTLENAHAPPNKMHGGISKTLERLRKNLYWPSMVADVKKFLSNCSICQQTKSPNYIMKPPMSKPRQTERCFQKIYIDLLGPYPRSKLGKIGIVIVLDHFSKFVLIKAIRNFKTPEILSFLKESVFNVFGIPETLVSDNGVQFRSSQFKEFLKKRGVHHMYTAVYSPQANASERVNRSIIQGIRAYIRSDHREWDSNLEDIGIALRSSYHQSIRFTPYYALFGQQMVCHGSEYKLLKQLGSFEDTIVNHTDKLALIREKIKQNIESAFEKSANRYNLRSKVNVFKIGEKVLRRNFVNSDKAAKFCAKFAPKFLSARVVSKKGKCLYELEDEATKKVEVFHQKDIKKMTS